MGPAPMELGKPKPTSHCTNGGKLCCTYSRRVPRGRKCSALPISRYCQQRVQHSFCSSFQSSRFKALEGLLCFYRPRLGKPRERANARGGDGSGTTLGK